MACGSSSSDRGGRAGEIPLLPAIWNLWKEDSWDLEGQKISGKTYLVEY